MVRRRYAAVALSRQSNRRKACSAGALRSRRRANAASLTRAMTTARRRRVARTAVRVVEVAIGARIAAVPCELSTANTRTWIIDGLTIAIVVASVSLAAFLRCGPNAKSGCSGRTAVSIDSAR
jgi:hypothetical protein